MLRGLNLVPFWSAPYCCIDRGGIPLNPAHINHIARNLGLEVSAHAPVEETIARVRACVERAATAGARDGQITLE